MRTPSSHMNGGSQYHGRTHHSCERREYAFMVLREYLIIFLKEVLKVRVGIIYISRVKSYDRPKIVSNIHKCFHFKWNKFCPKNYEILKFCIILCNTHMFLFCTNSQEILMQNKLENLVRVTYIPRTYEILSKFFFPISLP